MNSYEPLKAELGIKIHIHINLPSGYYLIFSWLASYFSVPIFSFPKNERVQLVACLVYKKRQKMHFSTELILM